MFLSTGCSFLFLHPPGKFPFSLIKIGSFLLPRPSLSLGLSESFILITAARNPEAFYVFNDSL